MALFYRPKGCTRFTRLALLLGLAEFFAERDFEVRFVPVAEDRKGYRVAGYVVAQGAEEVPVALHPGVAEGRDDVTLLDPGVGGRATGHDLFHEGARVYRQVEPGGVFGAQVGSKDAEVGRRDLAGVDQLVRNRDGRVRWYREAKVLCPGLGRRQVGDVNADDAAVAVGQGAARVAGGDRRVGLDQVHQRPRLRAAAGELGRKLPAYAAHYARGHRGLETRRAADSYR